MSEVDVTEFDDRLHSGECSEAIREIVSHLRKVAELAGPVSWRAHSTPGGGWGLTGKRDKKVFCRFDPKPKAQHVCVCIPGADENALVAAGTVHKRSDDWPWTDIKDIHGAKLLDSEIKRAYVRSGVNLNHGRGGNVAPPVSSPPINATDLTPMSEQVQALKNWYEDSVKAFVAEHMPTRSADLDEALGRIEAHDRRVREELPICFLGDSGVGKSTLINALVAGRELVLPSGGIGPLTALAMEVRYGDEPELEAEYHAANKLWQGMIFGLERGHEAKLQEITGHGLDTSLPADLFEDDGDAIEETSQAVAAEDTEAGRRLETLQKQAQLLVKGNQDTTADLPYLLDCLREAAGSRRFWGTTLLPEDEGRLTSLMAALAMGKAKRSHRCTRSADPQRFDRDIADHATGFLAPLIKTLHVKWPSPLLQEGIVLVDLPGVGVAGDVYKEVTRKWIFERAKAVVLVVGRAGVTDAAADLLRTSDFLTRLLFSHDEQAQDPVVLAVAMSHIDDVAETEWAQDKSKKKAVHLVEQFERARSRVRSQLRQVLERVWDSGDTNVRTGQRDIIERLASEALVFPVSAPQYRRFLTQDEEDRPFITEAGQSGVPAMESGLMATVHQRRREATRNRDEAIKAFADQVIAWAELIREQWTGGGHTELELKQLTEDLQRVMAPLRKEFLVRQGQFREFLKATMPERIGALVGKAKESARAEISRYVRSLRDAHWGTLRAAVRREGTFYGSRHINLPDDFARKFVEPVAEVWGKSIIQEIRKRTKEFASDCEQMIVSVADWCRSEGTRVAPKLLDAQLEALRSDIRQIDLAGRDVINGLREEVKNQLTAVIQKPIQRKCRSFVAAGRDIGPGVKARMLEEVFDKLIGETTDAASEAAEALLLKCFLQVRQELVQVMKDLDDPLENAADAILGAHRGRLERSDTRNRDRVLESVTRVTATRPPQSLAASVSR